MCLAAGCTAFLTKPIKQDVLLQAIMDNAPAVTASAAPWANHRFASRIPAFLENCRQNVVLTLEALDLGDFEGAAIPGHSMRGSGAAFGFQAITDFGADLQFSAEAGEDQAVRRSTADLSGFLDRVDRQTRMAGGSDR